MRALAPDGQPWPMWIGGHTDERPGRVHHEVTSPVTGEVVALVDQASPPDVDRAVQVAAEAMKAHRSTPRYVRAAWLEDAAQRFDLATDTFTDSLVSLIGKPRRLARAEALRGSEILRRCAAELGSLSGETLPLDAVPAGEGRFGLTFREPLGVVAAITPFNAPINLMLQKVAPALAMGNAVVIKPSPETAVVTLQVVQAISPAFPDGLLSVVCGGADTGQALVAHRNVAAVSLTGSTAAGESVLRSAGIKPVLLELGANSPNLVLADADLPAAASAIAAAAFSASGQQCVSAQRVIVAQPVADAFTDLLVAASAALVVGDPDHDATDIGPMVHQAARDRVVELIDDAERRGARVALDGRRTGLYLAPTIVVGLDKDSRLLHEEAFGPVVAVLTAADLDEAVSIANSVDGGLQASCFTNDLSTAIRAAQELRAGSVWINEASRYRLDTYPFGGVGRSGLGREGVRYAMEELSSLKFVGIRPAARR
jgi:acyl-CoA reductase-like NAD-dependent aldehyde dehydrogenase